MWRFESSPPHQPTQTACNRLRCPCPSTITKISPLPRCCCRTAAPPDRSHLSLRTLRRRHRRRGDAAAAERLASLDEYNAQLDRIAGGEPVAGPIFAPLAREIAEWKLPLQLFRDLLDAFAQDVVKTRYASYAEVLDHCRRSANPVGRLLLHLVDRATDENLQRSDAICSALQMANSGRTSPSTGRRTASAAKEDLLRFGVGEAQIASGLCDDNWRRLLALRDRPYA